MKVKLFLATSLLIGFSYFVSATGTFAISHASESLGLPEKFTSSHATESLDSNGNVTISQSTEPIDSNDVLTFSLYIPFMGLGSTLIHDEVFVSAGEFQMGCDPEHNDGYECNEQHQLHAVYLDDYYIDKYEVTNAKYAAFLNNRGANDCGPYNRCIDLEDTYLTFQSDQYIVEAGYENHPVNAVTWYGSDAYCISVERRLPTEAEWEKAARGSSDTRPYPWGDETPNCNLVNYRACVGGTSAVGNFPLGASPSGAMDMSGNIMEWVNDRYDADYYSYAPYRNPQGPDSGHTRVQKGAAWHFNELSVRVAARKHYFPYKEHLRFGFRCAHTP
ncbi:MAG: SUMF1/EgtB/PvdO family nonheme iron enzyme [Chloroflexota bacterium]